MLSPFPPPVPFLENEERLQLGALFFVLFAYLKTLRFVKVFSAIRIKVTKNICIPIIGFWLILLEITSG